jgi:CRP-like cAMP-binding protein
MFSTLEKTIILKSSTLFSTITAESLARVAQVADEVDCPSGTIVFRDGDPGDAVYIVAAGSVTMSVSNLELGVLRRGEPFGVLGALKNEGHRGEVRAAEDSVLLKVEREDLFMLMQGDTEIMKGIIGLLADRVVKLGELFLGWQPAASGACPRDEIAQERK